MRTAIFAVFACLSLSGMADASIPDPVCRLLAGGLASAAAKSALAPFERVKLMKERGQWTQGRSPIGLPKTKHEA
jgi:small basic protein (TIGR04137 family)